jgi:hypothetical protein
MGLASVSRANVLGKPALVHHGNPSLTISVSLSPSWLNSEQVRALLQNRLEISYWKLSTYRGKMIREESA